MFVSLNEDGWYDPNAPTPHLLKATWNGDEHYGELVVTGESFNHIVWAGKFPNSLTDILRAPVRVGSIFTVYESDDRNSDRWEFTVRDTQKL